MRGLVFPEKVIFQMGCETWAELTRQKGKAKGLTWAKCATSTAWDEVIITRRDRKWPSEASHGLCLDYMPSPGHPSWVDKTHAPPIILSAHALTCNLLCSSPFSLILPLLWSFPPWASGNPYLEKTNNPILSPYSPNTYHPEAWLTLKKPLANLSSAGCLLSHITWTVRRGWEAEWRRQGLAFPLVPTPRLIVNSPLLNKRSWMLAGYSSCHHLSSKKFPRRFNICLLSTNVIFLDNLSEWHFFQYSSLSRYSSSVTPWTVMI